MSNNEGSCGNTVKTGVEKRRQRSKKGWRGGRVNR